MEIAAEPRACAKTLNRLERLRFLEAAITTGDLHPAIRREFLAAATGEHVHGPNTGDGGSSDEWKYGAHHVDPHPFASLDSAVKIIDAVPAGAGGERWSFTLHHMANIGRYTAYVGMADAKAATLPLALCLAFVRALIRQAENS